MPRLVTTAVSCVQKAVPPVWVVYRLKSTP